MLKIMKKNENSIELYIIFLTILGQIAIDLYLPSVHGMMGELSMSQVIAQWTVSAYLFGYGFSQLLYGPLSDRIGRRKVILIGIVLSLCGSIGCTFAFFPIMILIFRMVQGLGSGAASVIARAIMRDTYTGEKLSKASSHMAMAWSLVPILAPVLGGIIERKGGWRFNFGFLMLFSLLFAIIIYFHFPETCKSVGNRKALKDIIIEYGKLFQNKKFSLNMIVLVMLFSLFSIFNVSSPFLIQEKYNLSTAQYSVALCIISLGYLIGSYINGKLIGVIKANTLTIIGVMIVFVDSVFMELFSLVSEIDQYFSIGAMFIIFIGLGLIFSNSLSECLQPFPDIAGVASAMYGFLVFVGGGILSALYSRYVDISDVTFFATMVFIALVMLLSYSLLVLSQKKLDNSPV